MPAPAEEQPFRPPDLDGQRDDDAAPLPPELLASLRHARIVHGSLLAGIAVFGVVAGAIVARNGAVAPSLALGQLAWLLPLGLLAGLVPVGAILRRNAISKARRDPPQALQQFLTSTIATAAIIEGPTLLAGVLHLLTGDPRSLLVCGGGLVLLLLRWPTRSLVKRFAAA